MNDEEDGPKSCLQCKATLIGKSIYFCDSEDTVKACGNRVPFGYGFICKNPMRQKDRDQE